MLNGKTILITGGTGTVGQILVNKIIKSYKPKKVIIFSRDEYKQHIQLKKYTELGYDNVNFIIGSICDYESIYKACIGVDIVIHAAALKHIDIIEKNPLESVKTNILGSQNVINASLINKVEKVLFISTDKANNPNNFYGATKMCADKLCIVANENSSTKFAVVRFGNIFGSRGSVVEYFIKIKNQSYLPITDYDMTRTIITINDIFKYTIKFINIMKGGEIFVPRIPSIYIRDLAKAINPNAELKIIGMREGERKHEVMISNDNAKNTYVETDYYIIIPPFKWWFEQNLDYICKLKSVKNDFFYDSNTNDFLTVQEIEKLIMDYNNYVNGHEDTAIEVTLD